MEIIVKLTAWSLTIACSRERLDVSAAGPPGGRVVNGGEEQMWQDNMCSVDEGQTWRGFARHSPSGEVYILVQDCPPGQDGGNLVALVGPLHHSEITRAALEDAIMSHADPEDVAWAQSEMWLPVTL